MMSHPSDDVLASSLDGPLPGVETHLASCTQCTARVATLRTTAASLRSPLDGPDDVTPAVMARIRPGAPFRGPPWLVGAVAALPAVAVLAWMVRMPHVEAPQARGMPVGATAWMTLSTGSARLDENAVHQAGHTLPLQVQLAALPSDDARFIAIYARDATGRITWLLPEWTDAAASPRCVELPRKASTTSSQVIALDGLPAGALDVVLVQSARPCAIPALDQALEADKPLEDGVQRPQTIRLTVR